MNEPKTGDEPISSPLLRAPPPRRRPAWRTLVWIVLAIVVAVVIAILLTPHAGGGAGGTGGPGGGHGRGGAAGGRGGGMRRPPTVVGVATATLGDIPIELTELGSVTPQASVTVHTRIAGTLMAVYFTEGQTVRAGQLLALVDPRPYQVALEQAEGQLLHDQAALEQARLDLARYKTLAAQDSIARQQLDQQVATVKQDEGTVRTDQASVDSAKLNLVYCRITAPVSGRVGLRQVDAGNFIQTSDTNGVVVINQVDPITVIFTVPEDNIPQINARMAATKTLPVTAYDRTGGTMLAQGELQTLDNQIDSTTGTVKGRARFANPNAVLFPSQFVNVTLLVDTLKNVVTVPAVAIRHGPQGDFVYVVQPDSTVKVTLVKVGPAQGETASIASGLAVGDQVVTDGGDRLSDGSHVVLPQDAAQFAATFAKRQRKPAGFFGWLQGLFGHKPAQEAGGAPAASGEGAAGGGQGGGRGGAGRMQAMIGQLGLTPDQQAKARQIFADAREKAQASDDPDARRAAMRDAQTELEAILTPEQKARFEQLRAQRAAGGGAGSGAPAAPTPAPAPSVAP
ncbi:MAG: MdtA/MuxA family multidrug efflux RND transporter periplasmic adaptor subunit, partial [Caulobacteraceae bacterium]|nr:MdtA/MuxA family multidrug efflux RND transporter periplasmic adaptor subunit [Caulobacteraceae bacterium]